MAKKDFKKSAASVFMTQEKAQEGDQGTAPAKAVPQSSPAVAPERPAPERPALEAPPVYDDTHIHTYTQRQESKNKRLQSLIRPSTHQRLRALAAAKSGAGGEEVSVNELVNQALERFLDAEEG